MYGIAVRQSTPATCQPDSQSLLNANIDRNRPRSQRRATTPGIMRRRKVHAPRFKTQPTQGASMRSSRFIFLMMLVIWLPQAPAQEILRPAKPPTDKPAPIPDEKLPPALTHYMGREIAQTMHFTGAPWL